MLYFIIFILIENILISFTNGKVCETEVCKTLSSELQVMIDKTVDPCDDFSSYICGNMGKLFAIPPGGTVYDPSLQIEIQVTEEMKTLLENQPLNNHSQPQTKAALFYKSCLNMKERNKESESIILRHAKRLQNENSHEKSLSLLLASGLGSSLISMNVEQDPKNPDTNILFISLPSLILSEGTLQDSESSTGKEQITSYVKYMNTVLDKIGLWKENKTVIDEIVKLHIRLAKRFPSIADQSNPLKYTNKLSIQDLQNKYPELSWLQLINGVFEETGKQLKETEVVLVTSLDHLASVNDIIKEYKNDPVKKQILMMDIVWAFVSNLIPLGSETLIEANDQFQGEILGATGKKELWKRCVDMVSKSMVEIMGSMYVKLKFQPSQKKDIEVMIEGIRKALKSVIEETTWMDSATKTAALLKLKAIIHKIGYPDSLLSDRYLTEKYGKVQMSNNNFLENYINFEKFAFTNLIKIIGERSPDDLWSMGSQEVNAYYNPSSNEIVFPAAILRYPFYDINLPITYNYGATGATIGHEILHGFDTAGSLFDEKGLLRDWWTKPTRDEYLIKTQCIIDQYSKYSIYNESLPSQQTVGEDIADNAGLRMAYLAVNSKDEEREKLVLPGLDFTADQLFFVGEARSWCTIVTKNAILEKMKGDVHTIWKYRINGPLSNMPEFSRAFNCDRIKPMNRHKKCLVW